MCGIIGVFSDRKYSEIKEIVHTLFNESQIRGKHAIGMSNLNSGMLTTKIEKYSNFNALESIICKNKPVSLIGHCRYSTSDIEYNQPIFNDNISIVHNGVITQEFPENWLKDYGLQCEGKNDSELILRCLEHEKLHPLLKFRQSSIAAITITKEKASFYRNGMRPLWFFESNYGIFVASTRDILFRTFGEQDFSECEAGFEYNIIDFKIHKKKVLEIEDLQVNLECSDYYKSLN
jgi:glutamine phosphoribosylpyrophosphate amidotransferase